jgi:hypothetical protein
MSYIKAACISIAQQKVADGEAPPRKKPDDGDGGWLRPKEVGMFKKDPEQVRREAQHQAAFEAKMETDRQLHEQGHLAKDALAVAGLLEQLGGLLKLWRPSRHRHVHRGAVDGSRRELPQVVYCSGCIVKPDWRDAAGGRQARKASRPPCEVPPNPVHRATE